MRELSRDARRIARYPDSLHLSLRLPTDCDANRVVATARSEGVDIRPLSYYRHDLTEHEPGLVMGYGRLQLPSVAGIVGTLTQAIRSAQQ
jgi:DNA-binding transcriptional MocR family regulator